MLGLFKHKKSSLFGLDISSSSAKLLELSQAGSTYRVESFAASSIPENTIVEKSIKDRSTLSQIIERLVIESRCKTNHAAIAVPDSSVITKVLQVDAELKEHDIESHIAFEADKYIPYTLEEVNLDFDMLGPSAENPNLVDVLLVSCRSDTINEYAETLEDGGVVAKVVDVESYALERAAHLIKDQMPDRGSNKIIGIFNIGHNTTTLTVLNNFSAIFSRETAFGGQQLLEQVQERYQLTSGQALDKLQANTLPDDYHERVLEPFKEALVLHIRRALQFFFSSSQHSEVHHIVLAGGTANIEGLASLIQSQLAISASVADPFRNMTFAPRINTTALKQHASSMMLCCGLAMRSFD